MTYPFTEVQGPAYPDDPSVGAARDLTVALQRPDRMPVRQIPDAERQALTEALHRLSGVPDQLRQALTDQLWAAIPTYITEGAFSASLATGAALNANPQTTNLELISGILWSVPTGAVGQLVVGDLTLPNLTGVGGLSPTSLLIRSASGGIGSRSLTLVSGGPGPAAFWLFGQQVPTSGAMAR